MTVSFEGATFVVPFVVSLFSIAHHSFSAHGMYDTHLSAFLPWAPAFRVYVTR